jgi:hypothetical protein
MKKILTVLLALVVALLLVLSACLPYHHRNHLRPGRPPVPGLP